MRDYWYRFRIASTLAGLDTGANFFIRGLPRPQMAQFNDHATRRSQAQGGVARHGYNTAALLFTRLSAAQARTLDALITAAEAAGGVGNGTLYLTLPRTLAASVWIDVSGIVERPDWANLVDEGSEGRSYANVRVNFNAVAIEAEPSTVS